MSVHAKIGNNKGMEAKSKKIVNSVSNQAKQKSGGKDYSESANMNVLQAVQRKSNNTGLPDQLKSGIENMSGLSMDDVKVHYNSSKPSQIQAYAYTQGSDIHVAPGQERHLPHEAWHVVQQKQGRVLPTRQLKGISINDNVGLEKEADIMGEKAVVQGKMSGNTVQMYKPEEFIPRGAKGTTPHVHMYTDAGGFKFGHIYTRTLGEVTLWTNARNKPEVELALAEVCAYYNGQAEVQAQITKYVREYYTE